MSIHNKHTHAHTHTYMYAHMQTRITCAHNKYTSTHMQHTCILHTCTHKIMHTNIHPHSCTQTHAITTKTLSAHNVWFLYTCSTYGCPKLFWNRGGQDRASGRHLTAANTLSTFDGLGAVCFRPIQSQRPLASPQTSWVPGCQLGGTLKGEVASCLHFNTQVGHHHFSPQMQGSLGDIYMYSRPGPCSGCGWSITGMMCTLSFYINPLY